MNYFPPKSFIKWGTPRNGDTFRLGNFEIDPFNKVRFSDEHFPIDNFYWCGVSFKEGKFTASAWQNQAWNSYKKPWKITSPSFSSEEEAVRWLEKELTIISTSRIKELNLKLASYYKNNLNYLSSLGK